MAEALVTNESGFDFLPQHGYEGVLSETGIILASRDIEDLIANEITSIHERMHRVDTDLVCRSLLREHGLNETTVASHLNDIIVFGKVSKGLYWGKENLELRDQEKEVDFIDPKRSRMSDDEEKLMECRGRTIEEASRHEETNEGMNEKDEIEESNKSEVFLMSPGKKGSDDDTCKRLSILESKVSQIMDRIEFKDKEMKEKSEKESEREIEFDRLLSKVRLLERENEHLHDENFNLKKQLKKVSKQYEEISSHMVLNESIAAQVPPQLPTQVGIKNPKNIQKMHQQEKGENESPTDLKFVHIVKNHPKG
eukprot:Seg4499.1 transcript_id=Seg4499.1/GoldUCD/mRNA.D3Y31 product="hypothetical protein" protein_id=Seg4499.1/GoldUCD/D3Y31